MNDSEIIQLLGGVTVVARMLKIKPPSVQGWLTSGIPEGRLIELAAQIEIRSAGRFSRQERWPDNFAFYWPELAPAHANITPAATESVAPTVAIPTEVGALRGTLVRRVEEHDRRAKGGPPYQAFVKGED